METYGWVMRTWHMEKPKRSALLPPYCPLSIEWDLGKYAPHHFFAVIIRQRP